MPPQSQPRIRWLTPEEVRRLMLAPKPRRIHWFFIVAFQTGVRSEAIEEATWDRVDFKARVIDFRVPGVIYRNKRRPIAPINDELLPRLQHMYERRTDNYVIGLGRYGARSCTYQGCKDALMSIGIDEPGVARHVARHTFCSWRVQAGFSYAHIGALVGDTSEMVEKVYGHMSPHHLLAASNMDTSILRVA
jgi:integrase